MIGNGDVVDAGAAEAMLRHTGCDGVMIGRAAQGNPWIFRETVQYLETGILPPRPHPREVKELVRRHAALQMQHKGEYTAVREMRKHLAWYTAGYPHSARFRQTINTMETMEQLLAGLEEIFGA